MTSQMLVGALLVLIIGFGNPALGAQSARDEALIRELQARQQQAWNPGVAGTFGDVPNESRATLEDL